MVVFVRFLVFNCVPGLLISRYRNDVEDAKCPSCLRVCSVRRKANPKKCFSFVVVLVNVEGDWRPGGIATIVCSWKNVESSSLPCLPRDTWCLRAGVLMFGWLAMASGGVKWSAFSGQCRH